MLNVFTLANGRLFQEEIESLDALAHVRPVWVDLDNPTPAEKGWIAQHFGVAIPEDAVDDDLEESARFYEEDNGELHIRSDFLIDDDQMPRNVRVAFILFKGVLFSVHGEDLPVFRLLRLRARRIPALIEDAKDVLLKLYDADAEYSADALEGIYDALEAVGVGVLKQDVDDKAAGAALAAIAKEEDLMEAHRHHAGEIHRRFFHLDLCRKVRIFRARAFRGRWRTGTIASPQRAEKRQRQTRAAKGRCHQRNLLRGIEGFEQGSIRNR
jgi:magnesium transporter